MSEIFEKMKWEDIYSYWQVSSEKYMHALNPPHSSCNIEVKRNSQNRIYSYLWIRNDQIKQVSAELNGYAESTRFSTETILPSEAVLRALMPYSSLICLAIGAAITIATVLFAVATSIAETSVPTPI